MTTHRSEMREGVLFIDGQPHYLASAEYPYYRDAPTNWEDRMRRIRAIGFEFVTIYLPWRHHEVSSSGGPRHDFTGETTAAHDVVGFLRCCEQLGLRVVAKPGPFVHAELDYGGLPDRVCPLSDPAIEPIRDHRGEPILWTGGAPRAGGDGPDRWPLPAPFDPTFQAQAEHWLSAVAQAVLRPLAYPAGPIVAVQLGNEGIYSDAQHPPSSGDFSGPSLDHFAGFVAARDGRGDGLGPRTADPRGDRSAWASFQSRHLGAFLEWASKTVDVPLPLLVNVNPPLDGPAGVDGWLSRVEPEVWPGISYGFTDWIGVPSEDPGVIDRYAVMVKRARGPNLEENWGISDLYAGAYASGAVSLHQTLLAVALGATGHNVYPAVATAEWTAELDRWHARPYAPSAPIAADGTFTDRAELLALLNAFLARYGAELAAATALTDVAWGLDLPSAHLGAWVEGAPPRAGVGRALLAFLRQARAAHLDPEIVNLATIPDADLAARRLVVVAAARRMARAAQERLGRYADGDGQLLVVGEIPIEDEAGNACRILADARDRFEHVPGPDPDGLVPEILRLGLEPRITSTSRAAIWVREDPHRDAQFLIVLTDADHRGSVDFAVSTAQGGWDGRLDLPAGSSAIARVVEGRLQGALIKGINEHLGTGIAPYLRIGADEVAATAPADLLVLATPDGWTVHAVGALPPTLGVRLPDGSTASPPTPAADLVARTLDRART